MFWSAHSGIIAASSVVLARYVGFFVPLSDAGIKATAIAAILLLSFVNYLGVRQGSRLQTGVTAAKLAAIALLLTMALLFGHGTWDRPPGLSPLTSGASFREFVLGVSAALFAFGGWHMVTYTAGLATITDDVLCACAQIVRNAQAQPALNASLTKMDTMQMKYFSSSLLDETVQAWLRPYVANRLG